MGCRSVGQGWLKRPCAAMSGRKAVTFSGKDFGGFGVEAVDPGLQGVRGWRCRGAATRRGEFVGLQDGRELGGVEDLVGVGVADAGEDARVGERSLEGAVFLR
jgi:hypothetical protein